MKTIIGNDHEDNHGVITNIDGNIPYALLFYANTACASA